jgi:hypothetical protein
MDLSADFVKQEAVVTLRVHFANRSGKATLSINTIITINTKKEELGKHESRKEDRKQESKKEGKAGSINGCKERTRKEGRKT